MSESHPDRGSVALVTGAGGGIGAAVAAALVAIGCRVVCAGRRLDRLEATARRLGPSAHALELDVADRKSVESLFDRLPQALHDIDILVNNAGHMWAAGAGSTRARWPSGRASSRPTSLDSFA